MKVRVDPARCKGYGLCVDAAPAVFDLDDAGKAFVKEAYVEGVPAEQQEAVRAAELRCPERAITCDADA